MDVRIIDDYTNLALLDLLSSGSTPSKIAIDIQKKYEKKYTKIEIISSLNNVSDEDEEELNLIDPKYLIINDLNTITNGMTKDTYLSYIDRQFFNFDTFILIMDIDTTTTNSKEMLVNILTNCKLNYDKYGMNTKLIIIPNKQNSVTLTLDEEKTHISKLLKLIKDKIKFIYPTLEYKFLRTLYDGDNPLQEIKGFRPILNKYLTSETIVLNNDVITTKLMKISNTNSLHIDGDLTLLYKYYKLYNCLDVEKQKELGSFNDMVIQYVTEWNTSILVEILNRDILKQNNECIKGLEKAKYVLDTIYMLFSRKIPVLFDTSKTIRNKLTKYYVVDIFNKTKPLPLLFGHFDTLINYRYKMPNLVIDSLFSHPEMLIKPPIEIICYLEKMGLENLVDIEFKKEKALDIMRDLNTNPERSEELVILYSYYTSLKDRPTECWLSKNAKIKTSD